MTTSREEQQIKNQTLQQINHLVSASSPSDALDSIHALTSTLSSQQTLQSSQQSLQSQSSSFEIILSILTESNEFMKTICILLSESSRLAVFPSKAFLLT
jgi:ubiquinone biosynthesis protein Coq4